MYPATAKSTLFLLLIVLTVSQDLILTGTGPWVGIIAIIGGTNEKTYTDTSDLYISSMFDPSTAVSGFGGCGVRLRLPDTDGAFSTDFVVSYPSLISFAGTSPSSRAIQKASQDNLVDGNVGDFIGFQNIFVACWYETCLILLSFVSV